MKGHRSAPVGGGKKIRCLSEKDTMVSVPKNEREKSEKVWSKPGSGMANEGEKAGAAPTIARGGTTTASRKAGSGILENRPQFEMTPPRGGD
jgi:hypothetical protein